MADGYLLDKESILSLRRDHDRLKYLVERLSASVRRMTSVSMQAAGGHAAVAAEDITAGESGTFTLRRIFGQEDTGDIESGGNAQTVEALDYFGDGAVEDQPAYVVRGAFGEWVAIMARPATLYYGTLDGALDSVDASGTVDNIVASDGGHATLTGDQTVTNTFSWDGDDGAGCLFSYNPKTDAKRFVQVGCPA